MQDPELKEKFPNGIDAIVSTMMLNEGWDVNNVNVIVGLRSYGSKKRSSSRAGYRAWFKENVSR
jgi:DNA or RNA helicases of superfamily II